MGYNGIQTCFRSATLSVLLLGGAACRSGEHALFQERTAAETGVDFVNRVADSAEFNIIEYLYFYDGGGVAIGDINNDGLPDLYFTANAGPNRLYLNQGWLTFKDITEEAGVAGRAEWSTGVTMADVNGDGLLDIYVSVLGGFGGLDGHNELFINNGDLTFTEQSAKYELDFRGYSTQAAFFDYDGDGDLDMYLLNHSTHDEKTHDSATLREQRHPKAGDRLFRNDGWVFVDVSEEAGIHGGPVGYGLGVVASDLNLDGHVDIYVANDFHENDYLYLNNGDGTFTESIRRAVGHNSTSSMGVDAADVNNDGLPEIVVLDMLPDREDILKTAATVETEDVANFKVQLGYHHQYTQNTLFLNRGQGRFSEIAHLAGIEATDWSWSALLCDLDNDGWKDLFVTNGIWRRPNDLDYIEAVSRPEVQQALLEVSDEDLAILEKMPQERIANYAFRNKGNLTFENVTDAWGLGRALFSNGAAYGDLDNDGDLDLVVNNLNEEASIYENLGGGNHLSIRLNGSDGNRWGIGAKAILKTGRRMQVQELSPTRGFQSAVDPRLHFGLGKATIVDTLIVIWPDGSYETHTRIAANSAITLTQSSATGHFDYTRLTGAGEAALFEDLTDRIEAPYRHVENAFSDFTREPLIPHKISTEGPALAVGDVDGDGLDDIYVGGAKWQAAALLIQTPEGGFRPSNQALWRADSLYEDVDAAFFDADGDGDLDLYVVSAGNEWWGEADALRDRLYLNDGAGRFVRDENALPPFFENGSIVRPADFDGDGDVDLFVGGRVVSRNYGETPRSYLLQNDGGRFTDVTYELAPAVGMAGMVTDAVWTDYDSDGMLDLVVVGEWMPVRVFRQTQDGFVEQTQEAGFSDAPGMWTSIKAVDLNADGAPDLVLGNLGLNSRLRASDGQPIRLYRSDFDGDGDPDHILTSYRHGVSYPVVGRDDLLAAFPSLANQYPTYRSYGAARIEDVFSRKQLEDAGVLEATTLTSMVALNRGDGSFTLKPLPREAQFAPVRAILTGDFDQDGHTDLILAGNFFGAARVMGRADALYGQYLRGLGDGTFVPLEPGKSELWLEGEIRKLSVIRRGDGAPVIVAAPNDGPLQFVGTGRDR